jgi:SPP1 family predicted phage head-tail adaptor
MSRERIARPQRKVCLGDLRDKIIIKTRDLEAPVFGETTFTENFDRRMWEVWASIKTATGKVLFNGVNTDVVMTHEIIIRWHEDVTASNWVELKDGRLLDIISVENLEERNEFLKLACREQGLKSLPANQA